MLDIYNIITHTKISNNSPIVKNNEKNIFNFLYIDFKI